MQVMMRKASALPARAPAARQTSVAARAAAKSRQTASSRGTTEDVYNYAASLPGIIAPFADGPWDPAGLLNTATIRDVRRWRESELTHGRVAMLAALGFIIGEQLEDFPAFLNADGHVTGPAINHFQQVEARGAIFWEPLVVAIGLCESFRVSLGWATPTGNNFNYLKEEYEMGNLYFDPLGLKPEDEEEYRLMQDRELSHGRLAMIAIAGFVAQELVLNQEIFQHLALRLEREVELEVVDVEKELKLI